jgi:hypothetical protein
MAEWSVKPQWKKSIIERNYYHKDGATITAETGWRWGEFTVYTEDDNPPDIESGVDIYNCDYEAELVETSDGCWEEVTVDDPDLEEWLEEFLEENSYYDLEEHDWVQGDCEMIIDCDLIIERVDGDEEQIIHTGQTEEEINNQLDTMTAEADARAKLEKSAQWPFGPEPASTVETAKWPFDRPQEGSKE